MYSNIPSVQILVALLKAYQIHDCVLSPGGSDIPLIHSIETDPFFTCYSVVDERSAAYFAMGVSQSRNKPVACICTSGTAVCNYLPGITEAWYQHVPVVAITADKDPYFQGQLETQKIDQNTIFAGVVKKEVNLPLVASDKDAWLCNRLINEALLELAHHGTGPVHINIPIVGATNVYDVQSLPIERKISIISEASSETIWKERMQSLTNKRILFVVGQGVVFADETKTIINEICHKLNCVFALEHLSNLDCDNGVYTYPVTETVPYEDIKHLVPDVVISLGDNLAAYSLKPILRKNYTTLENWLVSEAGTVRDAYKCLTNIFECSPAVFFSRLLNLVSSKDENRTYFEAWQKAISKIVMPDFDFSNFYVAKKLAETIPEGSLLHLAILNSTRVMQFFPLNKGVRTYSNVGALGIDGCMSTFAGQSAATSDLSFLLIGDLSFFYDMNAASLRSIGNNVRIVMLNNGGGSEFHFFMGKNNISTINDFICAKNQRTAKGWIESLGFDYFSARTKEEFDKVIPTFGQPSDKPLFIEVFTDMEEDAQRTREFYKENGTIVGGSPTKTSALKQIAKKMLNKIKY